MSAIFEGEGTDLGGLKVAHLTTVDLSLRFLVLPQLLAVRDAGGEAVGVSAPGPRVPELEAAGIRHIPLHSSTRGVNFLADLRAAGELWRILRRERFDILHTHNPKPGLYGRVLGRLAGVPVIVNTVHGLYATPDDPLGKRLVVYLLEMVASRFSDIELIQSSEDHALLTRWRISPRKRTRVLGNGVDLARFDRTRFGASDRAAVRAELGATEQTIVVGMVGRLVAEKGYPELFEAAAKLGDRFLTVCIGPDDPGKGDALPREVIDAAERAGVIFLGMRDDVDRLYAAMDLFVLPSHREGFPRAAMEAAAMSLPVIATDIRGCREVVEHGRNGYLVPVRNPLKLAVALAEVGNDAELRERMGKDSRRIAVERFDERRVVDRVMASYGEVHRRKVAPRSRGLTNVGAGSSDHSWFGRVIKRTLDLTIASAMLVVLSPLLLVIALAVRAFLGQPVYYRQRRPGLHGTPFTIYKFRTMTNELGANGELLPDEDRMTSLGRFLRRTSLDELPELINVIKGDMSLVGPRPLLIEYLDRYNERQSRRHDVKPGLTGWVQVSGRNSLSWAEKLELDVKYVENWSLALDLRILAATIRTVTSRAGINEAGEATASPFLGNLDQEE